VGGNHPPLGSQCHKKSLVAEGLKADVAMQICHQQTYADLHCIFALNMYVGQRTF